MLRIRMSPEEKLTSTSYIFFLLSVIVFPSIILHTPFNNLALNIISYQSKLYLVFSSPRTFTVTGKTKWTQHRSYASMLALPVPAPMTKQFLSAAVVGGSWVQGLLRGRLLRRGRRISVGNHYGDQASSWLILYICTVHTSLLLLAQFFSANAFVITAPVVTHCSPPLHHAVLTCQAG